MSRIPEIPFLNRTRERPIDQFRQSLAELAQPTSEHIHSLLGHLADLDNADIWARMKNAPVKIAHYAEGRRSVCTLDVETPSKFRVGQTIPTRFLYTRTGLLVPEIFLILPQAHDRIVAAVLEEQSPGELLIQEELPGGRFDQLYPNRGKNWLHVRKEFLLAVCATAYQKGYEDISSALLA